MTIAKAVLICKECGQILPVIYTLEQFQKDFVMFGDDLYYVGQPGGVTPNVVVCSHCNSVYLRKCAAFGVDGFTSTLFVDQQISYERDFVGGDLTITITAHGDVTAVDKLVRNNRSSDCAGTTVLAIQIRDVDYKLSVVEGGKLRINGGQYDPEKRIHRYLISLLETYISVSGW